MTAQKSKVSVQAVDRDFVLTRIIDAPRERVYKAWTTADQLAKWWGPRQYPARCEGDFRVGGSFRLVMVGPDGKEYPMTAVIKEMKSPERLVWLQDCSEHPLDWHEQVNRLRPNASGNLGEMLVTITFEESEGRTRLTVTMHFDEATDRDALVSLGMTEGWSESFEKLEEILSV